MSNCQITLIGGASASGKTALAHWLNTQAKNKGKKSRVITLDDFFKPRINDKSGSTTQDEPAAFDFDLFLKMVKDLSEGKTAQKPIFDHAKKARAATYETIDPNDYDVIFIEGILALHGLDQNPDLLTIYVEPESYSTLIHNRAVRDALGQWCDPVNTTKERELKAGVRDGFFNYILRTKCQAQFTVTNSHRFPIDLKDPELEKLNALLTTKESVRTAMETAQGELKQQLNTELAALKLQIEPIQESIKAKLTPPDFANNPDVQELLTILNLNSVEESTSQPDCS